jgi:hypothetical protein
MGFRILTQNLKSIITQNNLYYLVYGRQEPLPPISAGTEYFICNICDGVATQVAPPHPVWTNNQGLDVILMDAVALGGPNGLNN